jgi:hypothetical protein
LYKLRCRHRFDQSRHAFLRFARESKYCNLQISGEPITSWWILKIFELKSWLFVRDEFRILYRGSVDRNDMSKKKKIPDWVGGIKFVIVNLAEYSRSEELTIDRTFALAIVLKLQRIINATY